MLADAEFGVAKGQINPHREPFRSRAIADERSRRAREQRERRHVKTRFPLDSAAGFAQCRLTGTTN
jgi:hypothetical protein